MLDELALGPGHTGARGVMIQSPWESGGGVEGRSWSSHLVASVAPVGIIALVALVAFVALIALIALV